jgi:hypothetical protein
MNIAIVVLLVYLLIGLTFANVMWKQVLEVAEEELDRADKLTFEAYRKSTAFAICSGFTLLWPFFMFVEARDWLRQRLTKKAPEVKDGEESST